MSLQFSTQTDVLRKHLAKVMPAVALKGVLPILEFIKVEAESGKIAMTATDLEMTIISYTEATITDGGTALIPAKKLHEILKNLPSGGSITVSVSDKYKITLKTQSGQYSMMGINPDDYPEIPELSLTNSTVISADDMSRIVSRTAFAASDDTYKPAMNGINLTFEGDMCEAAATDSYRLARVRVGLSARIASPAQIIVPLRAMALLNQVDADVLVGINRTHVQFSVGDVTVIKSRIIDDRFPPYNSVIPADSNITLRVNTSELLAAVKRVALFTNSASHQVKLNINNENITLSGADDDSGADATETVKYQEFNGTDYTMAFNHIYLSEALQHLSAGDKTHTATMKFSTPSRAALLQHSADDESLLMLLMPMRL